MSSKNIIAIIGGNGFVGINLSRELIKFSEYKIVVLDVVTSSKMQVPEAEFYEVDFTNFEKLDNVISKIQPKLIIQLAGWGMSGGSMLNREGCFKVNVSGTQNVLNSAIKNNVEKFIYTSTYNTIFGGETIIDGDESLPYYPLDKHTNEYSKSKSVAEQLVIQSNGKALSNGKTLTTACVRPAAIYGIGEHRHFPRIIKLMDNGLFLFRIGSAKVDWIHIKNLIQGYILLTKKLLANSDHRSSPGGQSYFLNDGSPIENFEFLRPLCESRGRDYPWLVIPFPIAYRVSFIFECLHHLTGGSMEPFITRSEVEKVGIPHYFNIKKARDELGYQPTISSKQGGEEMALHYENDRMSPEYFEFVHPYLSFSIIYGLTVIWMVGYVGESASFSFDIFYTFLHHLALMIFRSRENVRILFVVSAIIHLTEGFIGGLLAYSNGLNTWPFWFLNTCLHGMGSLLLLLNFRTRVQKSKKN